MADALKRKKKEKVNTDKTWPQNNRERQKGKQLRKSVPGAEAAARMNTLREKRSGWVNTSKAFFPLKADWNVANGRAEEAREPAG